MLIFVWLGALMTTVAAADNWPDFRGPCGDGHSAATGLPLHWSESANDRLQVLA